MERKDEKSIKTSPDDLELKIHDSLAYGGPPSKSREKESPPDNKGIDDLLSKSLLIGIEPV
ncbi:hypothetical protein KKA39_01420 [Patescibacteria group bacterium]|nr:hypothetical protein [Patescibacteria group bacterium]MBU1727951.1 hypothetical protein [Patescibacteria group bacterium]